MYFISFLKINFDSVPCSDQLKGAMKLKHITFIDIFFNAKKYKHLQKNKTKKTTTQKYA